jgi:hypothetical protein
VTRTGIVAALACAALGVVLGLAPDLALLFLAVALLGWIANARPGRLVLLLLLWLPFEGWVLKFVPSGSVLLALSDVVSVWLALGLLGRLLTDRVPPDERSRLVFIGGPALMLAAVAVTSWAVNQPPAIDAVYWLRVYLRFVPFALVLANRDTREVVIRGTPAVAMTMVITQSAIGIAQYLGGGPVARFFWPGQFAIGAVASQGDTLATVGTRIVSGTLGHYNLYAMVLVLWLGVLLGAVSDRWGSRSVSYRGLLAAAIGVGSILVFLSQSRQGVAMLAMVYALWLARSGTLAKRARGVTLVAGVAAALYLVADVGVGVEGIATRLASLGDGWFWTVEVAKSRGYVVTSVAPAVLARASILGIGPGTFVTSYGSSAGPTGVALLGLDAGASRFVGDVGWVSVFSQVGLLGTASVVWLCLRGWRAARRPGLPGTVLYGGVAALATLAIGMLASTPLTYKGPSSALWVLLGILLSSVGPSTTTTSPDTGAVGLRAGRSLRSLVPGPGEDEA